MSLHIELQYYERAIIFCNLLLIVPLFCTDTSAENAGYQQLDSRYYIWQSKPNELCA